MIRRLLALSVLLHLAAPLPAQVGFKPNASPYSDIRTGTVLELYRGQIYGSGGPIPVGPRDGAVTGGRLLLRAKNTLAIGFGVWGASTVRSIVDADAPKASRVTGPIDHSLFAGEINVQFNITGGKQWHRLAPYAGIGLGLAKGEGTPAIDTSGYSFGTKFFVVPAVGTRIFLGARTYLRIEGRVMSWNLQYPPSYSDEPLFDPGTEDSPNAVNPTGRRGQRVGAPQISIGFGWGL